jgi:hypothetical protein
MVLNIDVTFTITRYHLNTCIGSDKEQQCTAMNMLMNCQFS